MKPIHLLVFLTLYLSCLVCYGQVKRFNSKAKLDTLFIDLQVDNAFPEMYQERFHSIANTVIVNYNQETGHKFVVVNQAGKEHRTLKIFINGASYVTLGRGISGLASILVGLVITPIYLITAETSYFFIFFYPPYNRVSSVAYLTPDLIKNPNHPPRLKSGSFNNFGGFFRKKDANVEKTFDYFQIKLHKMIEKIDKKLK